MKQLNLNYSEWVWLKMILWELTKKLPGHARHRFGYNATSWDLDDIYSGALEDACLHRAVIWNAIEDRLLTNRWPRVLPAPSFWLAQRLRAAQYWVDEVLARSTAPADPKLAVSPSDSKSVLKTLVLEYWDEMLVDDWLAHNLRDYTYFESRGEPDDRVEYEQWLDRVAAGKYFRQFSFE